MRPVRSLREGAGYAGAYTGAAWLTGLRIAESVVRIVVRIVARIVEKIVARNTSGRLPVACVLRTSIVMAAANPIPSHHNLVGAGVVRICTQNARSSVLVWFD